ncbi:hypothetical protein RIR_jg22567.t1 [Rhizophagus irregularis DAOM 181602=DAOM 197198]|nr:hypothetical protein RIR_jg22567.t1 [Rhizophagus irregularis DAOM 181602=DAOM 197198]
MAKDVRTSDFGSLSYILLWTLRLIFFFIFLDVKRNIRTELWEIIFKIVRRIYKLDFEIKGCLLTSAF